MSELLIVGNRGGSHVGGSFERAAVAMELPVSLIESRRAMQGPLWLQKLKWHALDRRPSTMGQFEREVTTYCRKVQPGVLLATGLAPLGARALETIRNCGTCCVNYLTDDPWNPAHRARWFFRALPQYDCVFTTRRSNLADLRQMCRRAEYAPFGYDPELFHPESLTPEETSAFASDVLFAGGADQDRAAVIGALIAAGFRVRLYGTYWDCFPETRGCSEGQADIPRLRKAIATTRVALCLVRRANRDGQCMRTFEVPAVGACMLVERTDEHVDLFGPEGAAVRYFESTSDMIETLARLLRDEGERQRLAAAAHRLIVSGGHRYYDRLRQMLAAISS